MTRLERRAAATPRVSVRGGRLFWEPSAALRKRGYKGQPLGPLSAEALALAEELNEAADADAEGRPAAGTVAAAIAVYLKRLRVAASTERNYRRHLHRLAAAHGALPLPLLTREKLQGWHDTLAATSGATEAASAWRTARAFLGWCVDEGRLAALPRKIKVGPQQRRRRIGTRDEVWALIRSADALDRPSIAVAVILLVTTMQREADVLELTTASLEDGALRLTQNKTGAELHFNLHPVALDRIRPLPRLNAPRPLVRSEITLAAYNERAFQRAFAAVRAHAARSMPSLEGRDDAVRDPNHRGQLCAGDLRRTGMVWAAEGGATVPQIVSASGHSIARGTAILEHYLPRAKILADAAVARLNMHRTPKVAELARHL